VIYVTALTRTTRVARLTGDQEAKRISRLLTSRPPDLVISCDGVDANDPGCVSCRRPRGQENLKVVNFKASLSRDLL
jgi:hypothetical protein